MISDDNREIVLSNKGCQTLAEQIDKCSNISCEEFSNDRFKCVSCGCILNVAADNGEWFYYSLLPISMNILPLSAN